MSETRYKSFSEFWPFYVSEHRKPATRLLHLIGTSAGIALLVYLIASGRWWLFLLGFVPGYGFAWLAHFLIEKNKPATFQYPLWSFMGDYKMIALMITGRMNQELERLSK
ncbi:MAG TPA: DUF962 domain-containing protein [Pyrinomonadaceae bacterium]|nr:DUF962 domain-containing protein [Pyrinomonadaceae bacterium]